MNSRWLLCLVFSSALLGCTHSAVVKEGELKQAANFVTYQCESNHSFDVAYLDEQALLRLPKSEYRLKQVPAGSGTKYILDDGTAELLNRITLRTKGDFARLELGRVVYRNCSIDK